MKNLFKLIGIIALVAVIGFSFAACGGDDDGTDDKDPDTGNPQPPAFVAVTSITGVPTTGTTNEELTLTGTVNPLTATNNTITWTIKDQGSTNSTLNGNKLTAANSGTVKVTATVANGKTETTNYTQDFDITINQFEGTTYTVTFKLDGGNISGNTGDVEKTVDHDQAATAPANPTKTGYTFTGWDKAFTNVISNLTVTAKYTANTYTVVYDKNAGDATGTMANSTHTYDTPQALTANGYSKTDYYFKKWNTNADGSGDSYNNNQSVINLTSVNNGTVTLYAQWEEVSANQDFYYGIITTGAVSAIKGGNMTPFTQALGNTSSTANITQSTINKSTAKTITFNGNGVVVIFVPVSLGELSAIKNAANVNNISLYTKTLITYNGIEYYLYNHPESLSWTDLALSLEY